MENPKRKIWKSK